MISSSLRLSTFQSGLSDSSIFSISSVLLCTSLFICSGAASVASVAGDVSPILQDLCPGTSTSASRCCSSAFDTNSSTSSPCLFRPPYHLLGLCHLLCTQIPAGTVVACSTGFHQTSSIGTIHPVMALCKSNTFHFTIVFCARFTCSRT